MNPDQPAAAKSKSGRISLSNVAALLIGASFAGQVLGFLRTKLVNGNFPTTGAHSTDAYFAAFNVPDFVFFTLAAGALGVAFMPVLSDRLHKGDRKGVWELSNSLMNLLSILMFVVGLIMLVFAKPLIEHLVAPGLGPEQLNTAASIMRLLAFNPLLFTLSGVLTSVQQTMGRFFFFAVAPLFYNASIICSILIFSEAPGHHGGPHHLGLVGLGFGAAIGAVAQLLIVIASGLGGGNITYYNNAFVLSTAPILLIGTAISTAAFPRLNSRLSQGRPDLFRKDFLMVLRAMIWIASPLAVVCYFCRGYLARLIYTQGSPQIATIFGFLTLAIFFRIMYSIISRWFYAQKDTRTPLFVSLFVIALNIVLAYSLARPSAYGVAGLALAQSIVAFVEVLILSVIMLFRDHQLFDARFWSGVWRIISVTGFSVVAAFIMISFYPLGINDRGFITLGTKLLLIAGVTFGVHISLSALFGLEEARPVFVRLRKIILKPVKIDL
jgi:putative peptidoglycan lipid II flippase